MLAAKVERPCRSIYPSPKCLSSVFVLLGLGAAVGFISGLFGIGGGFLMTPLLIFLGIPPAIAVASQMAQIVASSTTSGLSAFAPQGSRCKTRLPSDRGWPRGDRAGHLVLRPPRAAAGQLDIVIVVSYVTLFSVVGGLMLMESLKEFWSSRKGKVRSRRRAGEHPAYLGLPLRMRFHRSQLYASVIPLLGVAFFVGFAGAVLGIGGGFIMVPALLYLFRVPTSMVVGTSQFQILWASTAALMLHAIANQAVDAVLAFILIIGGVFGAQFGARAGRHLRADMFRFLLALLILGVGLRFAIELVAAPDRAVLDCERGLIWVPLPAPLSTCPAERPAGCSAFARRCSSS